MTDDDLIKLAFEQQIETQRFARFAMANPEGATLLDEARKAMAEAQHWIQAAMTADPSTVEAATMRAVYLFAGAAPKMAAARAIYTQFVERDVSPIPYR